MSTRLIQTLPTGSLANGASAVLMHDLNVAGTPKLPDFTFFDAGGFSVIASTTTTVTVQNDSGATAEANVCLWAIHTTARELGGLADMVPKPFNVSGGGSGGGGSTPIIFDDLNSLDMVNTEGSSAGSVIQCQSPLQPGQGPAQGVALIQPEVDNGTNLRWWGLAPFDVGSTTSVAPYWLGPNAGFPGYTAPSFSTEWRLRIEASAPDGDEGGESWTTLFGLQDAVNDVGVRFGFGWTYNSSANLQAIVMSTVGANVVDTGIAFDTNWHIYRIEMDTVELETRFYRDDVLVATIAAIPEGVESGLELAVFGGDTGAGPVQIYLDRTEVSYAKCDYVGAPTTP